MNKKDLARRLAKESHRSRAQAADDVDTLIHRLLMDLKKTGPKSKTDSKKAAYPGPDGQAP
ncbi:MAG TPA: hypothetical protein VFA65_22365 [Bryobacteraceae bacterium]|nr:hypothetical protein [Bryobacteraceae bacterium]